MEIKVLAFGICKDIVGRSEIMMEIEEGSSVGKLKQMMIAQYPQMGQLQSLAIACNEAYAMEDDIINAGSTIALIPPVSGG